MDKDQQQKAIQLRRAERRAARRGETTKAEPPPAPVQSVLPMEAPETTTEDSDD